jgi:hypothetical protein
MKSQTEFSTPSRLQTDLMYLEADLKELVELGGNDPNRGENCRDWWFLAQNEDEYDDREQWEKLEYSIPPVSHFGLVKTHQQNKTT